MSDFQWTWELCKKPNHGPCTCKGRKSVSVGSVCVLGGPWLELLADCFLCCCCCCCYCSWAGNFSEGTFDLFPKYRAILYFISAIGRNSSGAPFLLSGQCFDINPNFLDRATWQWPFQWRIRKSSYFNLVVFSSAWLPLTVSMPVKLSWHVWLFKRSSYCRLIWSCRQRNVLFKYSYSSLLWFFRKSTIRVL